MKNDFEKQIFLFDLEDKVWQEERCFRENVSDCHWWGTSTVNHWRCNGDTGTSVNSKYELTPLIAVLTANMSWHHWQKCSPLTELGVFNAYWQLIVNWEISWNKEECRYPKIWFGQNVQKISFAAKHMWALSPEHWCANTWSLTLGVVQYITRRY